MAGFVSAGEWQLYSGYGFQMPPTDMLPKVKATVMTKGMVIFRDTDFVWKIGTADVKQPVAIVHFAPPLQADDDEGSGRVECYMRKEYCYTVIAEDVLDPFGYVKVGAGGKVKKWVPGTDTIDECIGQFVQRPNVTPPQNSGKTTLAANVADEVVGIILGVRPPIA